VESPSSAISSTRPRQPRLAAVGIADSVSNGRIDLNHGLVGSTISSSMQPPAQSSSPWRPRARRS
jgi:hypothetical protein